jgi:DNA polymerase III gamma/tau subunit
MALALNLEESARLRRSVLSLLEKSINGGKAAEIFAATAQLAKQEKESFENILALFYSLLTDLLEYSQGPRSSLPRNPDLQPELETLSKKINLEWVVRATEGLDSLESRLKRNVGRQLGLDAYVASLAAR